MLGQRGSGDLQRKSSVRRHLSVMTTMRFKTVGSFVASDLGRHVTELSMILHRVIKPC
jgi:hypothetical protein